MENLKPFSVLGILYPIVPENQVSIENLTGRFYPGMGLYIKHCTKPVNSCLNFFTTPVCPGKNGFIALYYSYN